MTSFKVCIFKEIVFLSFLILNVLGAVGQNTYQRVLELSGDESFTSFARGRDSSFVMVGFGDDGTGLQDMIIRKTNDLGQQIWAKHFGGNSYDRAQDVKEDADGNYIVGGYTFSFGEGNSDLFLMKLSPEGDAIWTKTYGGSEYEFGYSVEVSLDSSILLVGRTNSFGAGGSDIYLVKTDSDGDTLWTRTYGGTSWDEARTVKSTFDGGYLIGGYSYSYGAGLNDFYFLKINSQGDTLWTKTYGGVGEDWCYDLVQTSDSCFVAVGFTTSFGNGGRDACVIKLDRNGGLLWNRIVGGQQGDEFLSIDLLSNDDVVMCGLTSSFGVFGDVYAAKIDNSGNLKWIKYYGGAGNDVGVKVRGLENDELLIGGLSNGFSSGPDFYLIKTDSIGSSGCLNFDLGLTADSASFIAGYGGEVGGGGSCGSISFNDSHFFRSGSFLCLIYGMDDRDVGLNGVNIYPNPSVNEINIDGWDEFKDVNVRIFNSQGRLALVRKKYKCEGLKLDISSLPVGVYNVELDFVKGDKKISQMFIKSQ